MTDGPRGDGWWQASDLKWYPPEQRPEYMAALPPPPAVDVTPDQEPKPAATRQVIQRDKLGVLSKLGQGGQGVVYQAPNVKTKFAASMVYKEYKPQACSDIDFTALAAMPALVEQSLTYTQAERLISIAAWPCAIIEDSGTPTGFVMPAIPDKFFIPLTTAKGVAPSTAEFQHLLNHGSVLAARGIEIDDAQRYTLLRETASALTFLHRHGVCVGDISPKNLLFSLTPHEAIYFIDCDAMRINTVSALPQVETPGWNAPAGEELATIYSDTYKLGLLALRLLTGDHDTTNPAHLPATTPTQLRQIITDTVTNAPAMRPLPEAWTSVLGHAIEHAQQQQKTPTPISTAPAPPPTPVVHSRPPRYSAAPLLPSAAPQRPSEPLPSRPPAEWIPAASRPATSRAKLWAGFGAAALVVVVLVVVIVALSNRDNSVPSSAPLATSSAAAEPSTIAAAPTSTQIVDGSAAIVGGPILAKWESLTNAQKKDLGGPYDNEKNTADNTGVYQQFDGGVLIYRNGGPVYFVWGKIRDAWNDNHASQGKLGYPTSDEQTLPDGSVKSTFEHGTITWIQGDETATVTPS
jgi:eukaryotic-like serine/threonine-protein kinase